MKTKAAILYELNKPLKIYEVEIPPLKRGQVLVKILYSGICRAQLNEIIGLKGPDKFLPHLLGHEASAIVVEVGLGVQKVKPNDYVVLSWIKSDGLDGLNSQYRCNDQIINAGAVTTFSEYAVVSENRMTTISRKMPADIAAILGCAIATGFGIVQNTLKLKKEKSIAIFGAGGIGSSILLAAKSAGANPIIVLDVVEKKLKFAKQWGATHVLHAQKQNVVECVRSLLPEGLDVAVDAAGSTQAIEIAFELIKPTGVCVVAGNVSKNDKISIQPFELIKGKRIIGTWGGETNPKKDIPRYVQSFLKGKSPIDQLITHRFQFEKINDAFDLLKNGEAGRIVLKIGTP